jgi:HD superfamily phosphohydrolase
MFGSLEDRYDPLYKALDTTLEVDFVERKLQKQFDRLKGIDNLGVIPLVFQTAHYSKYEHALGTAHQVINLLEVAQRSNESMSDHRQALIISALFLHLGHCPFTYSTERALLLASTLTGQSAENNVRDYITNKVRVALKPNEHTSEKQVKRLLDTLLEHQDYKMLYKYFSAALLVNEYTTLKDKFQDFNADALKKAVSNLLDKKNDGYKYLELADTADFVQRDALHFGAARFDISPKHLFNRFSEIRPSSTSEKKLVDYDTPEGKLLNRHLDYLKERFYDVPEVVWFSALYEKVLAFLIRHKSFDLKWLEDCTDDQFKEVILSKRNSSYSRQKSLKTWIERTQDLLENRSRFEETLTVSKVEFPEDKSAIDVECELLKVNKGSISLLAYPFVRGILLVVHCNKNQGAELESAPNASSYSIKLFQDRSNKRLLPLLQFIQRLVPYISSQQVQEVRAGLGVQISWSKHVRFEGERIERVLSDTLKLIDKESKSTKRTFAETLIKQTATIPAFAFAQRAQLYNTLERIIPEVVPEEDLHEALESLQYSTAVERLLMTPVKFLRRKSIAKLIDEIYRKTMDRLALEDGDKGNIFETLCIVDRIRTKQGDFQFFLYGPIVRDTKQRKDETEFDIVEFVIAEKKNPECCIYACSISDDFEKKNKEQIKAITKHIHSIFEDATVTSFYMVPTNKNANDWQPKLEPTRYNFNAKKMPEVLP